MRKRILPLLLAAILFAVLLSPFPAHAATLLDPNAEAELTLHYQKDGTAFSDLQIGIYRVAQVVPEGSFELIEPFASYPVNIHGITAQEQWNHVAQTLCSYIVADGVKPDREERTKEDGTVCFSDLKTGLYFVREAVAQNSKGTYVFNQFMIYLPTPQTDGSYQYDVEAKPKCTDFVPNTQYTVTKLWQDSGKKNLRPKAVTVDIYQDGALKETQILSAANNWSYTWQVSGEDHSKWTVTERDVPEDYKVTVQQNGNTFSIINTRPTKPDTPQTGDTFAPLPLILTMCLAGLLLLILGLYGRRHQ